MEDSTDEQQEEPGEDAPFPFSIFLKRIAPLSSDMTCHRPWKYGYILSLI
jgi:hypothetical protein